MATFSHYVRHGFDTSDFSGDEIAASGVDGVVFRVPHGHSPWREIQAAEQIVTSLDLDATVHVALAGEDPAAEPADDAATANRVAETLLAAWCAERTHVFLDTFADVDRGYFPRPGLTDRLFNPRLAGTVYRNLHAALRQIGPARWAGDAVDLPGARVCRITGDAVGILVLPTAEFRGSELTPVTSAATAELGDLATGKVHEDVDLTAMTCGTPVFVKQVAPERS